MDVKWKLWMEEKEKKIFGKGPKELLLKVDELGSLRQAAMGLGMSYSKAWHLISNLEKSLGIKVLEKTIGGADGGNSTLTDEGRELILKYERLEERVENFIRKTYEEIF